MRIHLALLCALVASPALAAADEPVATAPKTAVVTAPAAAPAPAPPAAAHEMTTAQQIDAYLRASPALEVECADGVAGIVERDDRQVHGTVSVGVGTGGYRSVYLQTDMPLCDNGRLSLAFEDTKYGRGGYPYGYYGGPGYYGRSGEFRGLAPLGMVDRQRCDLEGMSAHRPLDIVGGPNGRCVTPPRR